MLVFMTFILSSLLYVIQVSFLMCRLGLLRLPKANKCFCRTCYVAAEYVLCPFSCELMNCTYFAYCNIYPNSTITFQKL